MSNCIKCKAPLPENAVYCPMCGRKQIPDKRKALKRANGTGTVYKLSGRRRRPWVAARSRVILGYYETKTEALNALEKLSGKSITELYNYTFEQVYNDWKEEHFRKLTKHGIDNYEQAYKFFAPLYARKFRGLKTADFQRIIDAYPEKSYSTLSKYKQLATQMSKWAVREEIIQTNLADFVQLPPNVRKEKEIFTDEEIAKLEANNSEAAKIVLMLIYTGMRIGELFSLPLADYHGTYVIGGEKTEAGRNRVIPIRPEGRSYFAYFANLATGELLLSGFEGGKEPDGFRKRSYYPLLERLGIKRKSPHSTRHTYASWAAKNGIAPETLQKILGHSKFSTTAEIYIHADTEQLISAVEDASHSVSNPKRL